MRERDSERETDREKAQLARVVVLAVLATVVSCTRGSF